MEKYFLDVEQWLRLNAAAFGMRLLAALAVLVAGVFLSRAARAATHAALQRSPLRRRVLLVNFLDRVAGVTVMVFAGVVALGELGLDIGPLIAGIGITGFVVGFAFKDSLSNLAAGLLLLIYEPFEVGEFVEVGGLKGWVLTMSVAATELRMEDGKLAIMPNSKIWNAPMINHSRVEPRREA